MAKAAKHATYPNPRYPANRRERNVHFDISRDRWVTQFMVNYKSFRVYDGNSFEKAVAARDEWLRTHQPPSKGRPMKPIYMAQKKTPEVN